MLSFIAVNKMENDPRKVINSVCAGRAVLEKGSGRIDAEILPTVNDSKKSMVCSL